MNRKHMLVWIISTRILTMLWSRYMLKNINTKMKSKYTRVSRLVSSRDWPHEQISSLESWQESILHYYDLENECQVEYDVFDRMIEDVLFQNDKNSIWRFVNYFFNKMILAKCNYEIYDKKLLTIVRVFEEWRLELKDFKFSIEVISNHKNLKYFMFFKSFNRR